MQTIGAFSLRSFAYSFNLQITNSSNNVLGNKNLFLYETYCCANQYVSFFSDFEPPCLRGNRNKLILPQEKGYDC